MQIGKLAGWLVKVEYKKVYIYVYTSWRGGEIEEKHLLFNAHGGHVINR